MRRLIRPQCCAPVLDTKMIRHRASDSLDPRCQRSAKVTLSGPFGRRGFCQAHARIWREHYRIVQRITDILA